MQPSFIYVPYQVVAASSQSHDSRVDELSQNSLRVFQPLEAPRYGGWENARFCTWPQEVILRMETRAQVSHMIIMSKEDRSIPECEIYIGDGISGSFLDCEYRHAGRAENIRGTTPMQFNVFGIGNFVKIVFNKQPESAGKNAAGQVALGVIKIYGQPMAYYKGIVNEVQPVLKSSTNDEVDRVLLEMGVPLQQPGQDWTFDPLEKSESLAYAPVDDDTRQTLKEIQQIWNQAHKSQDFEKLTTIGKDIKLLLNIGNEILRLNRLLQDCIRTEDYEKAIGIRNEIKKHEKKRENFEMIYETSNFEDQLVMGEPSQQYKEELLMIEMEEMQRQEAIRRKRQEFEEEQKRLRSELQQRNEDVFKAVQDRKDAEDKRLKEDQEEKRAAERNNENDETERLAAEERRAANEAAAAKRREELAKEREERRAKGAAKAAPKQAQPAADQGIRGGDPLVHNEGDNDLEPFLKPLLAQAGGNVQALEMESLRRAYSDGTLTVAGVRLWNAVHSETWRHREASCEAFYQFLTNPKGLPPKYSKKTLDLFTATTEIAAIACRDKLLQIYFLGLKLLEEALSPKICGGDVPAKTVDRAIRPFVRLLIDKVGEMNYRARDISLNTLRMLFRHPAVELRHAIEGIMDITERPPGPAKAQWRLVSARLEILHQLVREFGVNDRVWNWQIVYQKLVGPSFNNANPDVRLQAMELTLTLYAIVGPPLRLELLQIPDLKQSIIDQVSKQMEQIDGERGGSPKKSPDSKAKSKGKSISGKRGSGQAEVRQSLEHIPESDEFREATPQGNARKKK